jgi:alpha-1,2-mannosyltransferase
LLGVAAFSVVQAFRPPAEGYLGDFTQDWLSARDFREGHPVYGDLLDAVRRHMGEPPPKCLRWNAHPPGSVVLVLPLAGLSHIEAFYLWNLVTFTLFAIALWFVALELGVRPVWKAAAIAAGVCAVGATSYPLRHQVALGQFNCLLAFLITVTWGADRRGYWWLAGTAVGIAMAIKLFPGFLLVYFLTTRQWRALATAVAVFLLVNGVALALFGVETFETYVREVIPAVSGDYATQWNNISAPAFWLRLFDPAAVSRVIPVVHSPLVGKLLSHAAQLVIVGCVAWVSWRAQSSAGRDRAFAAAVVGMLLVSPLTWPHALTMLVVPVAVLIADRPRGIRMCLLLACLAVMWLPDTFIPRLALGPDAAENMKFYNQQPLSVVQNLFVASVAHYALVGVFVLIIRAPNCPVPTCNSNT